MARVTEAHETENAVNDDVMLLRVLDALSWGQGMVITYYQTN
jgi:hypothetical protein